VSGDRLSPLAFSPVLTTLPRFPLTRQLFPLLSQLGVRAVAPALRSDGDSAGISEFFTDALFGSAAVVFVPSPLFKVVTQPP
jgi:hypothetical protein